MGLRSWLDEMRTRRSCRRLASELPRQPLSAAGVVEFLYSAAAAPITPWQVRSEFSRLTEIVAALRPRTVLEIGTADGGTLFAHARLAAPDALVISIDLPGGEFGGGYPAWRQPLYESFAGPSQELLLLRADSHAAATRELLERALNGRRLDYCFIDGDHTYEGVKQDFELCRSLVSADATIALHDVALHPEGTCRVHDLWRELKEQYSHEEIVEDAGQGWAGIGVVRLGRSG